MASTHEEIARTEDDCVCTFIGTITSIDRTAKTATLEGNSTTYNDVVFHYHCPDETTIENGHKSFFDGEEVLCLKVGDNVKIVAHATNRVGCETNKYVMVYIRYGDTIKYATLINPITKEPPEWEGLTLPNTYDNIITYINANFSSYDQSLAQGMSLTLRDEFDYEELYNDGIITWEERTAIRRIAPIDTYPAHCALTITENCPDAPTSCERSISYSSNLRNCSDSSAITCSSQWHPCSPFAGTYNFDRSIRTGELNARGVATSINSGFALTDKMVYSFDFTSSLGDGCIRVGSVYEERQAYEYDNGVCESNTGSGVVRQEQLDLASPLKTSQVTEFIDASYPYSHSLSGDYEFDPGNLGESIFFTHSILDSEIVAQLYVWQFTRIDDGTKDRFIHGAIEFFSDGDGLTSGDYNDMMAQDVFESHVENTIAGFEAEAGRSISNSDDIFLYSFTVTE